MSPVLFVLLLLAFPALTLVFGLFGVHGNGVVTAGYLLSVSAGLIICGKKIKLQLNTMDWAFLLLVAAFGVSTCLGFEWSDLKEYALMVLCVVLPYAASRLMMRSDLAILPSQVAHIGVAFVLATIVVSIPYFFGNGLVGQKRTVILGFDHAATVFGMAVGCLSIAFVHSEIRFKSVLGILTVGAIFVGTALFVAALVRFTFAAIGATILLAWLIMWVGKDWKAGRRSAVVFIVFVFGVYSATLIRPHGVAAFAAEVLLKSDAAPKPLKRASAAHLNMPSCGLDTREDLSIELRKSLFRDALYLIPKAGLFGFGIESFPSITCLTGYQVHNIFLQSFVELGWVGGGAFLFLVGWPVAIVLYRWKSFSRPEFILASFLVTNVGFFSLIGMAHGSVSRAMPLFLFLGAISSFLARSLAKNDR